MVARSGKEPAHSPAPSDEAEKHEMTSQATVQQAGRCRAGVKRQAQQSAQEHQRAAGQASGAKRRAEAMSDEERNRRRAAHAVEVRAAAKREREKQAAAAAFRAEADAFAAALQHLVESEALDSDVALDFGDWLRRKDLEPDEESLSEWRDSPHYEATKVARITEQCTCFLSPDGGKRVTSLPYVELKRRVDDGVLQAGESFEAWDERVLADRQARAVSIGDYFERPWAFAWCGTFRKCTCTYDGQGDDARMLPDVPGQNCDAYDQNQARQQLEPCADDWQPSGGDWVPEGWDGEEPESEAAVRPPSPPPPASPPAMPLQPSSRSPPPADYDSDAYELDQERMLEEQGRVSSIHARPWHEVPNGATEPIHWLDYIKRPLEWLGLSLAQGQQAQRPLSPAPERSQFQTEDAFQQEQARWFRDHSNGAELRGTRHEQSTLFSRLKDKLFGLRRARANPSGTPRALHSVHHVQS